MRFENPWLLAGLLAAAIPIIIHLINRKRATIVPFAAIDFILKSDKRLARKLKLKQLLALALRVSLMLAIPFALARPYCVPSDVPASRDQPPTSVVFVVDNSLSMALVTQDNTSLDHAKLRVRQLMERLNAESNVALVAGARPAQALLPELSFDRGRVLDALDAIAQTDATSDVAGAMRLAETLLASSTLPERRIILLTDAQASAFEELDAVWTLESPPPVEVVDVVPTDAREGLANAAIAGVAVAPAIGGTPEHLQIEVEVVAFGASGYDGPIALELGERKVENSLTVPAGGRATSTFVVKAGSTTDASGQVRLVGDALARDDRRAFSADLFTAVQVLLVNGAPRTVPYKDELFFVEKALRPQDGETASRFRTLALKASELTPEQIDASDVVVLANVLDLSKDVQEALKAFVAAGGGLFVAAGDNANADYNRLLGELLPIPVRDVKEVVKPDDPEAAVKALYVDQLDTEHPGLRAFANLRDASLFRARFYTYLLLDAAVASPDAKILASYRNGAPLLVERRHGRGRVVLMTTTLDRDWGDLPVRSSYLPLVQELVSYLGGRTDEQLPSGAEVGLPVSIPVSEADRRLSVERPDGQIDELSDPQRAGAALRYERTDVAGIYTVRREPVSGGDTLFEHFAVVPNPRESDIGTMAVADAEQALRPPDGRTPLATTALRLSRTDERRTNVWPFVLAGLFALLLSEAIVVLKS